MERINSPSNPRVKALVRLHQRRERDRTATFLIEGRREVDRAAAAGIRLETVYVCPALGGSAPAGAGEVVELGEVAFRKVSHRQNPDGVLAVAAQPDTGLAAVTVPSPELVLVVEGVAKPGNLGAMVRTAAAAGAGALVAAGPGTDPFNPNVVRAAQGALWAVPLAVAEPAAVLSWLAAAGIRPLAAAVGAGPSLWDLDYRGPTAFVIGAEDRGLSPTWSEVEPVSIPMPGRGGGVDSLNAATAAAVLLYEALRQRLS